MAAVTAETRRLRRGRMLTHGQTGRRLAAAVACLALPVTAGSVQAERIDNQVAMFAALDKVTARISKLDVPLNQTVEFGSLKVTPRACFSRPATEQPQTSSFVEVDEKDLQGVVKRVFTGWMFAESPGLNAVEHPVFDIWLTGCSRPKGDAQAAAGARSEPGAAAGADEPAQSTTRRRVRR